MNAIEFEVQVCFEMYLKCPEQKDKISLIYLKTMHFV